METVQVQLELSKSEKDVADVVLALLSAIKAKKGVVEISSELFPQIIKIASEYAAIGQDFSNKSFQEEINLVSYLGSEIGKIYLPKA